MARYLSVRVSRFLWLLMFAGLASLAGFLSYQSCRAMNSKHWPVTDGTVFAFYGAPNYRYSVGGASYVSAQVSCNEFFQSSGAGARANGEKHLVKYPLGGKVTVHYHPDQPQLAVLETDFDSGIFKVIGVLLLLCFLSAVGFHRGWRWRIRQRGWTNS